MAFRVSGSKGRLQEDKGSGFPVMGAMEGIGGISYGEVVLKQFRSVTSLRNWWSYGLPHDGCTYMLSSEWNFMGLWISSRKYNK